MSEISRRKCHDTVFHIFDNTDPISLSRMETKTTIMTLIVFLMLKESYRKFLEKYLKFIDCSNFFLNVHFF